jgi:hypothetical protein
MTDWQPEEWRPFDPFYEVSNHGQVRKKDGRLLRSWRNDLGYSVVRLNFPRRMEKVHRMVAAAFIPNPLERPTVNHIDCNRSNNRSDNLEWCTQAENLAHSRRLGRLQNNYWKGRRSPNAVLTEDQVRQIRSIYASGRYSLEGIAKQFKVSKRCIFRMIHRETYADVQ